MARLAKMSGTHKTIKRHLRTIQFSLDDNDISIRKRALDLLYSICDEENVVEILEHLLRYLSKAEYAMREEMVLKIAILAEKFATDMQWYINIVLQLLTIAGDFVTEDVWHRVVQIVTNDESLQKYAAQMVYENLQNPPVHESLLKVGGYILGEFGHLLESDGKQQFNILHKHFQGANTNTKALLLSTYMKFANMYEDLVPTIVPIFQKFKNAVDPEIQQRAVEYEMMTAYSNQELISQVWDAMPDFPERESNLMKIVRKREGIAGEKDVMSGDETENEAKEKGKETDVDNETETETENAKQKVPQQTSQPQPRDLLSEEDNDVFGAPTAASTSAATTASKPPEGDLLSDLFGGGDDFAVMAATAPSIQAKPATIQELTQDRKLWRKLFMLHSSVLYEDSMVQIGIKSQVENEGGIMRLIFFYGNKLSVPLQSVSVQVKNVEGVEIELSPSEPFDIDSQQQQQQKCRVSLMQPPAGIPSALISFTAKGQQYRIDAQLPVIVTKFFATHTFDASQFKQRWDQVQKEEKQVIRIGGENITITELRQILTENLSIGLIEGIDKKPENVVGCARLTFASKRQGKNVMFPVLLRVEFNEPKQALRITIRTPHEGATKAVLQAVQSIFEN